MGMEWDGMVWWESNLKNGMPTAGYDAGMV